MFEYVKDAGLLFNGKLTKRKKTEGIVIHHLAGRGQTVTQVHNSEIKSRGWIGIGYNFYVRQDGTVWKGRGLEYVGAHSGRKHVRNDSEWAEGAYNNNRTVGIGFEGYYHPWDKGTPDKVMPEAQFNAGVKLIKDLLAYYGEGLFIKKHKEMPSTATSCPGDYFPFDKIVAAARGTASAPTSTPAPTTNPGSVRTYTVKKGDTLSAIARAHGLTLSQILAYNPQIKNANVIDVGQVINVQYKLTRLLRVTTPLTKGEDVKAVQRELNNLLDLTVRLSVDGKYGKRTASAVAMLQRAAEIQQDGIVGKDTAAVLGMIWDG